MVTARYLLRRKISLLAILTEYQRKPHDRCLFAPSLLGMAKRTAASEASRRHSRCRHIFWENEYEQSSIWN